MARKVASSADVADHERRLVTASSVDTSNPQPDTSIPIPLKQNRNFLSKILLYVTFRQVNVSQRFIRLNNFSTAKL